MAVDEQSALNSAYLKLKLVQLGAEYRIPEAVVERIQAATWIDRAAHHLVAQMRSYIHAMGEERIDIDVKYPRNWWEAVKESLLPKWALRRWPVDYKRIEIHTETYAAVCPHIHAMPPKNTGDELHISWFSGFAPEQKTTVREDEVVVVQATGKPDRLFTIPKEEPEA